MSRLDDLPNSTRLTQAQAAKLMDCCEGTIAARRYAGLLPYSPTKPITVLAGDLKVLRKMLNNGAKDRLHRGLRILAEDCPTYSRLDGIQSLTYAPYLTVVNELVDQTHYLYNKYRDTAQDAKARRARKAG